MARYIDADALNIDIDLSKGITVYDLAISVVKAVKEAPIADVVERSECEKWYHEYHVIKDALKQEKEYHRSTEKLADKYQTELDAMRGAANSYKMHYEKAKQEADRLSVELEAEKTLRVVRIERIFEEIEASAMIQIQGLSEPKVTIERSVYENIKRNTCRDVAELERRINIITNPKF